MNGMMTISSSSSAVRLMMMMQGGRELKVMMRERSVVMNEVMLDEEVVTCSRGNGRHDLSIR